LQKHGMKILGNWAVPKEHLAFAVLEAPSSKAFQKLGMEPEALAMSAYETYEVKSALDMKEVVKRLRAK
jgi:peptidase E